MLRALAVLLFVGCGGGAVTEGEPCSPDEYSTTREDSPGVKLICVCTHAPGGPLHDCWWKCSGTECR